MKKVFLKADTKIIISRSIISLDNADDRFETTVSKALKDDDFSTCNGTMRVCVELHPDEYKNFHDCRTNIKFTEGKKRLYLNEADCNYGERYQRDGTIIKTVEKENYEWETIVIYHPELGHAYRCPHTREVWYPDSWSKKD